MKGFLTRTRCVLKLLVVAVSPIYCDSFSTIIQKKTFRNYHRQRSTFLGVGRDRRDATSKHKLVSDDEVLLQKRLGQMKHRLQKEVKREDRISVLEITRKKSTRELAELEGLLKVRDNFEEQYKPEAFTKEHIEFKTMHNDAFIQLSKFCDNKRETNKASEPISVFFLDGPDSGTARALIQKGGFQPNQCFVANRHKSSCELLRKSGGGLLPDENVVYATAAEALTLSEPLSVDGVERSRGEEKIDSSWAFAHKDFAAYYFDGCGGFVPHMIGMLSAALLRENCDDTGPIAIGYSLLGGNKDVVKKELTISRALTNIARTRGMEMKHVMDDPFYYGLSPEIQKIGGSNDGTFTTWVLLQARK